MRMEVGLVQRMEQRMHLSQQMLQNLELLQLPIMELRDLIISELQENPTLEERQESEEREAPASGTATEEEKPETPEETAKQEMLEQVEQEWLDSERRTRRTDSAEDAERRMDMLNNVSTESTSLRQHLERQLALLEVDEETRNYCDHVIQNIDPNGYITFSLEDMVASLPEELRKEPPEILLKKLENAVAIIQKLEPRGVGARSIKECLLLQLDENGPLYPLLRKLIDRHAEDVGANRLPKIAKALAADPETLKYLGYSGEPDMDTVLDDVKILIEEIRKLNPKPGASYSSDVVPKVYPEVTIKQVDGKYEIVLEDGWLPPISINRSYEEMLRDRRVTPDEKEFVEAMSREEKFSPAERECLAGLAKGKKLLAADRERLKELREGTKLNEKERALVNDLLKERTLSKPERDFMKQKMDAGRKLITAIEQRRGTIYRITNEILKHQREFFEEGIEHLKPLKMQEVADAVGIHLSTVSRAISDKWVETPRGIFPLKFFFASAAPKSDSSTPAPFGLAPAAGAPENGDDQTRLALMEKIREIIAAEDKKNPLSDLEIVRRLKDEQRITAARRTIAKYREELHIPSSRLRKQY